MASSQATIDELLGCLTGTGRFTARKMFGEYCVYLNEKPVALVCDDQLFIKPTAAGRELASDAIDAPPYPGAKPHLRIARERWPERGYLHELFWATFSELPPPKPRKKKK